MSPVTSASKKTQQPAPKAPKAKKASPKAPKAKKPSTPEGDKPKRVIAPEHLEKLRLGRQKFLEAKKQEKEEKKKAEKEENA